MVRLQLLASVGNAVVSGTVPSSVCCRASSATASPILLRTDVSCSLPRHCSMRERMASRSGWLSVRKASAVCPLALLHGFEDCRLKRTAANVRVWQGGQRGVRADIRTACSQSSPGRSQSAQKGPSAAHLAFGRTIHRSAAARQPSAPHCLATGGPAAGWSGLRVRSRGGWPCCRSVSSCLSS